MELRILGQIEFDDVRRTVPVGIPVGVSRAFLFFAKEVANAARRTVCFADIRTNPDYSEHSLLTPVDGVCYPSDQVPYVLIFVRPEVCTETIALHEMMHAYLYFAEGYSNPRAVSTDLPFHVRLFAGLIGNIAADLHANQRLAERGFALDSLREEYFSALEDYLPLMEQPGYADDPGMQWQIGAMWGHMLAGADFYRLTDGNRRTHSRLQRVCKRSSPGTVAFRDLLVETCWREGVDTAEKVGHIVDEVAPVLFQALGEPFRPEYLHQTDQQRQAPKEQEPRMAQSLHQEEGRHELVHHAGQTAV